MNVRMNLLFGFTVVYKKDIRKRLASVFLMPYPAIRSTFFIGDSFSKLV